MSHILLYCVSLAHLNFSLLPLLIERIPFLIAPGCTELQIRKLKNKNIEFLKTERIDETDRSGSSSHENVDPVLSFINTADREKMIQILRGTRIQQTTIDKIIKNRPYSKLDELESKAKISKSMRDKIEDKIGKEDCNLFCTTT